MDKRGREKLERAFRTGDKKMVCCLHTDHINKAFPSDFVVWFENCIDVFHCMLYVTYLDRMDDRIHLHHALKLIADFNQGGLTYQATFQSFQSSFL